MKIDIIASFYRQERFERFFWWGIEQNRDAIGRVIVVNDEDVPNPLTIPAEYLCHPHRGEGSHGVAESHNMGIRASSADYVFTVNFDQILPAGTIAGILEHAAPNHLVVGAVHTIASNTTMDELPNPRIFKKDGGLADARVLQSLNRQWFYGRNGHTLIPKKAWEALGGFDEEYVRLGYGLEDLDFAVRFGVRFGLENIIHGPTASWHFGDEEERPKRKVPSAATFTRFTQTLATLYGPTYNLFAHNWEVPQAVNVAHVGTKVQGADTLMDCVRPMWIPDGSALTVYTRCPNPSMRLEEISEHLSILKNKIQEDGSIIVRLAHLGRGHVKSVADRLGFEIDEHGDHLELFRSDL